MVRPLPSTPNASTLCPAFCSTGRTIRLRQYRKHDQDGTAPAAAAAKSGTLRIVSAAAWWRVSSRSCISHGEGMGAVGGGVGKGVSTLYLLVPPLAAHVAAEPRHFGIQSFRMDLLAMR